MADVSERAQKVHGLLEKYYPEAKCFLDHSDARELLVATILSAQCTDERVNKTTPALFKKYRSFKDFANSNITELEQLIRSTGFYRNKAKNIKACAQTILSEHGGEVPKDLEKLSSLPGVGRKTANVVLGNIFGIPGMVVDTHVGRLSRRMGFTKNADPVKVEHDLMKIFKEEQWTRLSLLLISHGRAICEARRAHCERCFLKAEKLCPQIGVDKLTGKPIEPNDKPKILSKSKKSAPKKSKVRK